MKKKYSYHNLIHTRINLFKESFKRSQRMRLKGQIHLFRLEIMAKLCMLILIVKLIWMEYLRLPVTSLLALTKLHWKIGLLKDNFKIDFYSLIGLTFRIINSHINKMLNL